MRNPESAFRIAAVTVVIAAASVARAEEAPPLAGCYERVYGAAHLLLHKGQMVVRATLSIEKPPPEFQLDKSDPIIADGNLKVWVRGRKASFDSHGACRADAHGLLCGGSLSAAEADTCKSQRDGIRECRIDPTDSGSFRIDEKPEGVLVTITERLELVPAPYDAGPFLSLSPTNAENHAFLLKKTSCK